MTLKKISATDTCRKTKISAVVISKNEARQIVKCIQLLLWCDEIILIDNSNDNTVKLAKEAVENDKLTVIKEDKSDDFSYLRNLGLKRAKYDWVFFVDADHRVTEKLKREIQQNLENSEVIICYRIRQLDFLYAKPLNHGETSNIYHLLLAKKGKGKWKRRVHEKWEISGKVKKLKNPILHYPHPTISEFIKHNNRWSSLDSREFLNQGKSSNLAKLLIYPLAKFFKNYFLKAGILDGFPGLVMAYLMSFHSLLVRSKMIEKDK